MKEKMYNPLALDSTCGAGYNKSEVSVVAFQIEDLADLLRLIHEHPEWRDQLRAAILPSEVLALPQSIAEVVEMQKRFQRLLEAHSRQIQENSRQIQEHSRQIERLQQTVQAHNERLDRLEADGCRTGGDGSQPGSGGRRSRQTNGESIRLLLRVPLPRTRASILRTRPSPHPRAIAPGYRAPGRAISIG